MAFDWRHDTGPIDFRAHGLPDADAPAHRELYVRDGSRFVRISDEPPAPVVEHLPPGWSIDPGNPGRIHIDAPTCPHGHSARWATRNCRPCSRSTR
jgi:hypothetical protein